MEQQIRSEFDKLEYWQWEASFALVKKAKVNGFTELAQEMLNDF
jgi:hypothetical protein